MKYLNFEGLQYFYSKLSSPLASQYVSQGNLKTINGQTLLGNGDVDMSEFATQGDITNINQTIDSLGDTYATKTELDGYLPLTGGLLIGNLNINSGNYLNIGYGKIFLNYDSLNTYYPSITLRTGSNSQSVFIGKDTGYGDNFYMYIDCSSLARPNTRKIEFRYSGITITGKSTSDLLNAGGSTTPISDIVTQVQESLTVATTSADGLMSAADKTKLDGIDTQNLATKSEVNAKVSGTGVSSIQVVATLPDVQEEGVLYIVTGEGA